MAWHMMCGNWCACGVWHSMRCVEYGMACGLWQFLLGMWCVMCSGVECGLWHVVWQFLLGMWCVGVWNVVCSMAWSV